MESLTKQITRVLSVFLIFLMALIVIDVTWQVFTRFIINKPSSFTEELAGFLLIWIGLLGASYALYTRAHLGIDILTMHLKGRNKIAVEILIALFIILFAFFILVLGGLKLVALTFTLRQISPALGMPMGYVYIVLPLTGVLMIYYSIYRILTLFKSTVESVTFNEETR